MVVTNSSFFIQTLMFVMNQSSIQQDNSYNYYYLQIGKLTNATKCYGIYGCFQLGPPWTSEHRPISVFPEDLDKIEPRYYLYTRADPSTPVFIDLNEYDVIGSAGIDPILPVYVISHGFMEGGHIYWILETVRELLALRDCSVIVVDWQGGSTASYTNAVANIRLVGVMTAYLLGDLATYTGEAKLDHVHCIGHSLGAHLCGYVGYTLQDQFNLTLDRITGLDPAEPHFAKAARPVRLDKSAARYVDVIHTDGSQFIRGGLGMTERIGHVDYFPNGGTNQPGCEKSIGKYVSEANGSFIQGIRRYLGCNHLKSHEYFLESINPQGLCPFTTVTCSSFDEFQAGNCFHCGNKHENCIKFGYHGREDYERLASGNQTFSQYLLTGANRVYCRAHYRISVTLSDSEESRTHGGDVGQLYFTLHSTVDRRGPQTKPIALNNGGYNEPGQTYIAVMAAEVLPQLKGVEVELRYQSNALNPLSWRFLAVPTVYVEKVTVTSLELGVKLTMCPKEEILRQNGKSTFMLPTYC